MASVLMAVGSAAFTLRCSHSTHALSVTCSMAAPLAIMSSGGPAPGEPGYKRAKLRRAWSKITGGRSSEVDAPAEETLIHVMAGATDESAVAAEVAVAEVARAVAEAAAEEAEAAVEAAAEVEVEEEVEAAVEVEVETKAAAKADVIPEEAAAEVAAVANATVAVVAPGPKDHDSSEPGPRWSEEETERFSRVELAKVRSNPRDPASPAEAFRTAGEGERLIDEMELACCWLQHEAPCAELPLPRFRVTARPSKILEPELRQMANVLRRALDRTPS